MLPRPSSPIVQPAASHQDWNRARPSASASVRVWRLLPPATPGPILAISIRLSHSRSPLILRFSPGAAIVLVSLLSSLWRAGVFRASCQRSYPDRMVKMMAPHVDQPVKKFLNRFRDDPGDPAPQQKGYPPRE